MCGKRYEVLDYTLHVGSHIASIKFAEVLHGNNLITML